MLTNTEQVSVALVALVPIVYMLVGRRIGAYLASRVRVVMLPLGGGEGSEVIGRIRGDTLEYTAGGSERTTGVAPEAVMRIRRRVARKSYVFVDARSGVPFVFPQAEETPRHLWSDRITVAAKHLLKAKFKGRPGGPLADLAPYLPLMMLMLLAMVAAVLYGVGRSQGWF